MAKHPPLSHRDGWAGRNVAVGPNGYPLSVDRRCVGLEVTKLLLLLDVEPALTTGLWWWVVKATVLVCHGVESGERGTLTADRKQSTWQKEVGWAPEAG